MRIVRKRQDHALLAEIAEARVVMRESLTRGQPVSEGLQNYVMGLRTAAVMLGLDPWPVDR